MRLFTYKMKNDSGFAPNPFFGYLTLATCKPGIRRTKKKGDWVAGFTSKFLDGSNIGEEKLVFLMKVDDEVPIYDYYNDPRFGSKIPIFNHPKPVLRAGDNIYKPQINTPLKDDDYLQIRNHNHWNFKEDCESCDEKKHDLSGKCVLISQEYWYYGRETLIIPARIRPNVPVKQTGYGSLTDNKTLINDFIEYVYSSSSGKRIIARPDTWWDDPFDSWKSAD